MNIVFLTLGYPKDIESGGLYPDLMEELAARGNQIIVVRQDESRSHGVIDTQVNKNVQVVSIPTGRLTKTNIVLKTINTVLLGGRFWNAIRKLGLSRIDVLLYSTPPITFDGFVTKIKKRESCITYLLLKDIFPQNAVDLGFMAKRSLVYKYFREKERRLYRQSDLIGCMSPANLEYLVANNPDVDRRKIRVTPNCIRPFENTNPKDKSIFDNYGIKKVRLNIVYGGNLGKPQGVDFILEVVNYIEKQNDIFFTIIGNGTEFARIQKYIERNCICHTVLISSLPKKEYRNILSSMDVGMLFLDSRFTIPNFPSRVLDYMDLNLPIIACTDVCCDIKDEICFSGAGFWCNSVDINAFVQIISVIYRDFDVLKRMGVEAKNILKTKYNAGIVADELIQDISNLSRTIGG